MPIDDALKDIAELLDLPLRSGLLHKGVASSSVSKLLPEKKQAEVLGQITGHLRSQAQKDKQVTGFRDGNIKLFGWILKKAAVEHLESFPALTRESGDGTTSVLSLTKDIAPDLMPLSPPELWPQDARCFAELFPARYVLSTAYHIECPNEQLWTTIANRGVVRLSPLYESQDDIQEFVSDSTLTDDATHKSRVAVTTSQIAFLREKNVGLIDSARKSKAKCLSLLRFLAGYLIRANASWKEHPEVPCECGKAHKCWKAGWVTPLKRNKWVYVDKNRSETLSVDSLARLLKEESEVVNLLSEQQGPALLAELGVSAGDFLMRVVASDEPSRVALSKSFIQMVQATGGDIKQATDLAHEIAIEIQGRAETQRMVKRNQGVGKAVEDAIEAALKSDRGLTVKREPVGSDYAVRPESVEPEYDYLDEAGREVLLKVDEYLIEVKATVGESVRMTETQGKKAKLESNRYALCVVALSSQEDEINAITVREKARFVFDIGTRVKPLVEALESIQTSKSGALTTTGHIELEMDDQLVKFKVGRAVWEAGVGFEDAVLRFGGRKSADVSPTASPPKRSRRRSAALE